MIGFDEDYNVKASYDGYGWNQISKSLTSVQTNEDGRFDISLLTGYYISKLTTNHNDVWIRGTLQPMETNWDYVTWNLKVTTRQPLEVVCYGFQNTNNLNTNEYGTVFDFIAGETNISFVGKLFGVFETNKSVFHKRTDHQ